MHHKGTKIFPVNWTAPLLCDTDNEAETEMRTVIGTIMGRYNKIATCFETAPYQFEPLFLERSNGQVIASDWADGLLDAIALRPKAWEPLDLSHKWGHAH